MEARRRTHAAEHQPDDDPIPNHRQLVDKLAIPDYGKALTLENSCLSKLRGHFDRITSDRNVAVGSEDVSGQLQADGRDNEHNFAARLIHALTTTSGL